MSKNERVIFSRSLSLVLVVTYLQMKFALLVKNFVYVVGRFVFVLIVDVQLPRHGHNTTS